MQTPLASPSIKSIQITATVESAQQAYEILAKLLRAELLEESFLTEVRRVTSFFSDDRYRELTERYLALMIASQEFPNITEALPEHRVLGDSNPDWTFRTKQKVEFYVEVSAISIQKIIDEIQAFGGRIPTSKVIGRKIDEKKRSNKLDKIGNVWLCIVITTNELRTFAKDSIVINRLRARISRSKWLKGLVVAELLSDRAGNLQLRSIRI